MNILHIAPIVANLWRYEPISISKPLDLFGFFGASVMGAARLTASAGLLPVPRHDLIDLIGFV